ncbi:cell division protein FtsQ/DivIB [soil metagenome]
MQPVSTRVPETDTALAAAQSRRAFMLPPLLRRLARAIENLRWRLPRNIGLKGVGLLFAGTTIAGVVLGGHITTIVSAVTAWGGLAITDIKITGQSETSEVDVLASLEIGQFPSLLTFDVEAAKTRVEGLPWIEQVTLKKFFPSGLEIKVVERKPFALWQHDGEISLIDEAGKVISPVADDRYASLPFVVGGGAAQRAKDFVALIDGVPEIAPRVKAGVLISGRRWTVVLDNGIDLMLPIDDPGGALVAVAALDASKQLLSRDIAAVDLRLPGRTVIRLTAEGLDQRKAMLKQREKLMQRGKANT